jgi:hypothetical protein
MIDIVSSSTQALCSGSRTSLDEDPAGLHLIWASRGPTDWRALRQVLRMGIDGLIASWQWRARRQASGRRVCLRHDGTRAPPISIAYSHIVAMLLVSNDGRKVGVDLEISRVQRLRRYALISQTFTGWRPDNAMSVFVRAEAWAKATDYQFVRNAGTFLRRSWNAGLREDGRFVSDVDISSLLPCGALPSSTCAAAAICTDAQAPPWKVHPIKEVLEDGRLLS